MRSGARRPVRPGPRRPPAPAAPPPLPLLPALLVLCLPAGAGAQVADTAAVADTVPADTAEADTAAADTAGVDVGARREALAGGEFPSRDSLFRRLAETGGYRAIEYRGREASLTVDDRVIRLRGDAQANYEGDVLRADSITYRGRLQFMRARHGIELVGSGREPVESDSVLYYDVSRRRGTIYGAETRFAAQGTDWNVTGNAVPTGTDTLFVEESTFTSCTLEEPHYRFRAGQVKVVSQNVVVAWPVVLQIGRVPIAWLPFFAQDIRPHRRSGILPPRFGFNDVVRTSPGMDRHIQDFGYYWAVNRFMDAEVTMDWFSGNWTEIGGRFRYRFLKRFMDGNLALSQNSGSDGRSLRFAWNHNQELSPSTRLRVSANFVQNTSLFEERTFEPRDQTETIDTDVGLSHRLDWVSLNLSARRRQFLGPEGRVTTTLPSVTANFSQVTLFPAPRGRAGPFNNMTWSGSASFSRFTDETSTRPSTLRRTGNVENSLRVRDFSLRASADVTNEVITPLDTLMTGRTVRSRTTDDAWELLTNHLSRRVGDFEGGGSQFRTAVDWQSSVDYQVDLVGSTTLRPTASVDGLLFASNSTGGDLVSGPMRTNVGASLSTDVYGFFPGFGPFSRVRHKVSPSFSWRYSPPVELSDRLREIPELSRGGVGDARNTLTVSLSQTFEAKIPAAEASEESGAGAGEESGAGAGAAADTAAGADTAAAGTGRRAGGRDRERKVTLLSVRSSGLQFDFEGPKEGRPVLATETVTNNLSSDLLQGLSMNVTHDLFREGEGGRTFSPFLTQVGASFRLRSGTSLSDLVGLGGDGDGGRGTGSGTGRRAGRGPGGQFGPGAERQEEMEGYGSGPWDVRVSYSLSRGRPGESRTTSQTVSGTLNLNPTPNWRIRWDTQYNFSTGEFGSHELRLERSLHRWRATFRFNKTPSGNFQFDVSVSLTDAPELHVDYQQQTVRGRR